MLFSMSADTPILSYQTVLLVEISSYLRISFNLFRRDEALRLCEVVYARLAHLLDEAFLQPGKRH